MSKAIDRVFKDAISEGVFPSAQILVAKGGEVALSSHYGSAREHTSFDISSLTKPFCTASLAMMLCSEGLLKDSDTVYQWLPGAREPRHKQMTVRHLLDHTSGLPAWQAYYRELPQSLIGAEAGRRFILDSCYAEPIVSEPGEKTLYSDIGFMILGEIVAQAAGMPLDELFSNRIAGPLKLADTLFVRNEGISPSTAMKRKDSAHLRFAPTEDCPWRGRVLHGEVHDQNAYAMGGVAGHAGLFSTAGDLHKFISEFVKCYRGGSEFIPKGFVRGSIGEAAARPKGDEYVFGWNRPSRRDSSAGMHFSANSIGHMGYTGCSAWIDLEKNFWIILLTNRIHPSTMNEKIKGFRPRIHDLIYDEILS